MKYNFLNNPTFDSSKIKDFTKFLFVFDGAYAYSPKRFNAYLKSHKEKSPISSKITKIIDTEKRRVSYTPLLDMLFNSHYKDTHLIFYFAQTSIKDAKRLAAQIQNEHDNFEVSILGYSWGGDASMRFAKHLQNKNIKVKSMFTLDPIRRGFMFLGFRKSIKSDLAYFRKLENVEKYFNIYQKTDRFALPLIHLRGNRVEGADLNLNLSDIDSRASHVNLHSFQEVKSLLSNN